MSKETDKPKTLNDCPAYVAAWERLMELRAVKADLHGQICESQTKLHSMPEKSRARLEAEQLLGGTESLPPGDDEVRESLGALYHRQQVILEAEKLQKELLERERLRASKDICQALTPEFQARVDELAAAAKRAIPAIEGLREFLMGMEAERIVPRGAITYGVAFTGGESVAWSLNHWLNEIDDLKSRGVL